MFCLLAVATREIHLFDALRRELPNAIHGIRMPHWHDIYKQWVRLCQNKHHFIHSIHCAHFICDLKSTQDETILFSDSLNKTDKNDEIIMSFTWFTTKMNLSMWEKLVEHNIMSEVSINKSISIKVKKNRNKEKVA